MIKLPLSLTIVQAAEIADLNDMTLNYVDNKLVMIKPDDDLARTLLRIAATPNDVKQGY